MSNNSQDSLLIIGDYFPKIYALFK